jgi:hypothetical protein
MDIKMKKKFFVVFLSGFLALFFGALALADACKGELVMACGESTSAGKKVCANTFMRSNDLRYDQCVWFSLTSVCMPSDASICEYTSDVCQTLNVYIENASQNIWTFVSSDMAPYDGSVNYQAFDSVGNQGGNHQGQINYYTGDPSVEKTILLTYENQKKEQLTFAIKRNSNADPASHNADVTISPGDYYAKMVARQNCSDDFTRPTSPSVTLKFLDPPMQTVKVNVGFGDTVKATLASNIIFSHLDLDLVGDLDINYGEPITKGVDENGIASFIFRRPCYKDACGYSRVKPE